MNEPTDTMSPSTAPDVTASDADSAPELIEELLVEEISIDGMCGVY